MNIEIINKTLAFLTLIADIKLLLLLLILIFCFLFKKKIKLLDWAMGIISKHALLFGFIVVTFSTAMSLFYSEFVHLPPCSLCWYQRIFMFSQVFLLGMAVYKEDRSIIKYSLLLSIVGALIAIYHLLLQYGIANYVPCSINSVSCADNPFTYFGFVTIPVMSLTSFLIMIFIMGVAKWRK